MINKMTNLFEVKEQDSIGTAVIKGATSGFLKGFAASSIGLVTFVVGIKALEYYVDNSQEEEEEEEIEEQEIETEEVQLRTLEEIAQDVMKPVDLSTWRTARDNLQPVTLADIGSGRFKL